MQNKKRKFQGVRKFYLVILWIQGSRAVPYAQLNAYFKSINICLTSHDKTSKCICCIFQMTLKLNLFTVDYTCNFYYNSVRTFLGMQMCRMFGEAWHIWTIGITIKLSVNLNLHVALFLTLVIRFNPCEDGFLPTQTIPREVTLDEH